MKEYVIDTKGVVGPNHIGELYMCTGNGDKFRTDIILNYRVLE